MFITDPFLLMWQSFRRFFERRTTKVIKLPIYLDTENWLINATPIKFILASIGLLILSIAICVSVPLLGVVSLVITTTVVIRAALYR